MSPSALARTLAVAGLAAGATFLLGPPEPPWLRLATKPIPALALALWVMRTARAPVVRRTQAVARLFAAGLAVSALGDVLLERGWFLAGLLAFLVTHLVYVSAFLVTSQRPALARAVPFALWGTLVFLALRPRLGEMTWPVALYVAVVCATMWRAAARAGEPTTPAAVAWLGLAGAIAFGASDTILAFDRFQGPLAAARWSVMLLYWCGQWGIAASAVRACGILPPQVNA